MTKREMFNAMINGEVLTAEMKEFAKAELAKLDNRKPSKAEVAKKEANVALANALLDEMVAGAEYTVADMANAVSAVAGLSGSKITYLVNSLVKDGLVMARYEKRKTYYSKA